MNRFDWEARLQALSPTQRQLLVGQLESLGGRTRRRRGDAYLAAYVAADQFDFPDEGELRAHLAETLPEHMIPARFFFLDALPKTPNGKIDRSRLPAPELFAGEREIGRAEPSTQTEKEVAAIWVDVLETPFVGLHDDFFELGGHSLLVTLLVSRLRRAFDIDLPLTVVFEETTVFKLARAIDNMRWASPGEGGGSSEDDREEFSL